MQIEALCSRVVPDKTYVVMVKKEFMMKIFDAAKVSLLAVALFSLAGCFKGETEAKPAASGEVSAAQAVKVINILDKALYDDAHIEGSINIPYETLEKESAGWNKAEPIVVYCANYKCTASSVTARMLTNAGFTNVRAYEGGMAEWYQLSKNDPAYKVAGPAKEDYLAMSVTKPAHEPEGIKVISAEELKVALTAPTTASAS